MSRQSGFKDKVVIITGASSGLGLALAKRFAGAGAISVLAARSADKLQRAAAEIETIHAPVLAIATDVSSQSDVENLVATTLAQFGRIDLSISVRYWDARLFRASAPIRWRCMRSAPSATACARNCAAAASTSPVCIRV